MDLLENKKTSNIKKKHKWNKSYPGNSLWPLWDGFLWPFGKVVGDLQIFLFVAGHGGKIESPGRDDMGPHIWLPATWNLGNLPSNMGGKFPHPSATGGNLRPPKRPTGPAGPAAGWLPPAPSRNGLVLWRASVDARWNEAWGNSTPGKPGTKPKWGWVGDHFKKRWFGCWDSFYWDLSYNIYRHILYICAICYSTSPPQKKREIYHFWCNCAD